MNTAEKMLERIIEDLIELPVRFTNANEALTVLTELCRQSLESKACTLVRIDLEQGLLTQVACAGFDEDFEAFMAQHKIKIGALQKGVSIDYNLLSQGDVIKRYDLFETGGGIANPDVAKRYGLHSALCYPLKYEGRVIGFLNHFSSSRQVFNASDEQLLRLFARQAESIIKQYSRESSLIKTKKLLSDLLLLPPTPFLDQLPNRISDLIPEAICIVWTLDFQQQRLRVAAAHETVDEEYRALELDYSAIKSIAQSTKSKYISDVSTSEIYKHKKKANAHGWVSLLTVPLWVEDQLIGLLDIYTKFQHQFTQTEREMVEDIASLAALSIQKADLLSQTNETWTLYRRLEGTVRAMSAMAESRKIDRVLMLLIRKSLEFTGVKRGWVRRINSRSELEVTAKMGTFLIPPPLSLGTGIAWKAIIEKEAQLANDVRSEDWVGWYSEFSPETRAELAIPLLIHNVRVQEGTNIKLRSQSVGVLNLESPRIDAFTESHIRQIQPLARQAALLIDWLESEQRLRRLREVEREIAGKKNWRDVLQTVVTAIRDSLEFEHVNVSLVDMTHNVIKSEYVVGMSDPQIEEFKGMSIHSLDSSDINADIVRTGKVEVIAADDPRFDLEIYKRFKHKDLIRVFIPMKVPSTGEIIGTVEAGYRRGYRDFINERDIQFLQSFVAYVVEAIEPSKRILIETISHELRSSIVGIRSNADYLRLLWQGLSQQKIYNKLSDMLADSEILLLNVSELEYFLGRSPQAPKIERISVVKDLIIKTVNQLTPLVKERRFDYRKIDYSKAASFNICIYAERAKLSQVIYNLLFNAIKYAEDDPAQFSIEIGVEDLPDHFVLRFADYGIGISEGLEEKIFEYAFRTEEAKARNVTGSGLGLTIARERMRELGGDLVVSNNSKPTDFRVLIPKKLMEAPVDSIHR